jgi:UDP-glucose 4-epimerase
VTRAPIVLITGATGFVGRHLCQQFQSHGWTVRGLLRPGSEPQRLPSGVIAVRGDLGDIGSVDDGAKDASAVVHLAARVHRRGENSPHLSEQYRVDNVSATRTLVQTAARCGVRRLVFVSTVRVHGATCDGVCRVDDAFAPPDPYAESKLEAEGLVRGLAHDVEWVIVRPTFVYGRGAKGNFERLVWLTRLSSRIPLPLEGLAGLRSIMDVENLASLLYTCVVHPSAARRILLAADDPPIATNRFIRLLGEVLGCHPRLYRCPERLLRVAARLLGRGDDISRLADSYVVDTEPLASLLGWRPPVAIDEALRRSVGRARG